MKVTKKCSEWGGSEIYQTVIGAGGGYAPDMLPGAHPWYRAGTMEVYVCGKCGHYQFFVAPDYVTNIKQSKKFKKYSS